MITEEINKLAEQSANVYLKKFVDKFNNGTLNVDDLKNTLIACAEHMGMIMSDRLEHGNFELGREESNAVVKVCSEYMNQASLFPEIEAIAIKAMDGSRFSVEVSTINYQTDEKRNIYTEWKDDKVLKKAFYFIEGEEE